MIAEIAWAGKFEMHWKMKTKWIDHRWIAATALVLQMGPVIAVELPQAHANRADWLCPAVEDGNWPDSKRFVADRYAIEELMTDWAQAVLEADLETITALVTADAEFWTHGAAPLVGRNALIAAFKPFLNEFKLNQGYDCKELIISGSWAFMRGVEVNQLTPRDGGETVVRKQRAFSVLRRAANGNWQFARGMTNLPQDE